MNRLLRSLVVATLLVAPAPLVAGKGAVGLNLVNGTDRTFSNLYIRRTGTTSWQPLVASPPRPAKGIKATSAFSDPDCAFDLKITLDDSTEATWPGVNLCEVKSLTLNRNDKGVTWVDYD